MHFCIIPWRLPSNCVNMIQKWFCYERWRRRKENRNSFMDRYLRRTCLRERIAERNKIQAPKTWETDYVQVEFFFIPEKKTALRGRKIPKSNPIFFRWVCNAIAFTIKKESGIHFVWSAMFFFFFLLVVSSWMYCCCFSSFSISIPDMLSLFSLWARFVRKLDEYCKSFDCFLITYIVIKLTYIAILNNKQKTVEKRNTQT